MPNNKSFNKLNIMLCQFCFRETNGDKTCDFHKSSKKKNGSKGRILALKILKNMDENELVKFESYKLKYTIFKTDFKIYNEENIKLSKINKKGVFVNDDMFTLIDYLQTISFTYASTYLKSFIKAYTPELYLRFSEEDFNYEKFIDFARHIYESKNILNNKYAKNFHPYLVILNLLMANIWFENEESDLIFCDNRFKESVKERNYEIIKMRNEGVSAIKIAKKYGLNRARVYNILNMDKQNNLQSSTTVAQW